MLGLLLLPLFLLAEEKTIGYLGVSTEKLTDAMMASAKVKNGVLVSKVYKESPAEKAGIEIGDIIFDIDGEVISDFETLKKVVAAKPGEKAKIKIMRSGKEITKTAELGEKVQKTMDFTIDVPDIESIKEVFITGSAEIKAQLEEMKEELEALKAELEELKKKIK
jgi:C-terminal processing protease CtpA/Prc